MANFDSELFGPVFPGFQATHKIHAHNSPPELSAFLSNFTFLNPRFIHGDFLLSPETNKFVFEGGCGHFVMHYLALFKVPVKGGLTKIGSVTF